MTNEQRQVKDWMLAFGQECPEKPTLPSLETRKLRARLILEEALETIRALGFQLCLKLGASEDDEIHEDIICFYDCKNPDLTKIADGCEDLKVVTEGTLVACGLCPPGKLKMHPDSIINERHTNDPLFNEVMRSNWSKFWSRQDITSVRVGENITSLGAIGTNFDNKYDIREVADNKYIVTEKLETKIIKSPSYSPANLQPIINEMSK